MDIQTFVSESLNQIIKGVERAQETNVNSKVNPADTMPGKPILTEVDFDIAVTVEKTSQSGDVANGKITVRTGIFDFGGGASGDSQLKESNATTIPCVGMPTSHGIPVWFILPDEMFEPDSDIGKALYEIEKEWQRETPKQQERIIRITE